MMLDASCCGFVHTSTGVRESEHMIWLRPTPNRVACTGAIAEFACAVPPALLGSKRQQLRHSVAEDCLPQLGAQSYCIHRSLVVADHVLD